MRDAYNTGKRLFLKQAFQAVDFAGRFSDSRRIFLWQDKRYAAGIITAVFQALQPV
jgi:hypothetical protein